MTDVSVDQIVSRVVAAADWGVAAVGATVFTASWLEWIDSVEKIVIGGLTIILLLSRVRALRSQRPPAELADD